MRSYLQKLRATVIIATCAASAGSAPAVTELRAQGLTTAAIRGTVRTADGGSADGARVRVVNTATGFIAEGEVRYGRFMVQGLPIGGPYAIGIGLLGFIPQQRNGVFLTLGEPLELELVMQPAVTALDSLVVIAGSSVSRAHTDGGTATTVFDSLVHRLPTLNRDLYDFVRLVPQISTRVSAPLGGLSGGGVGFRFNNFLINGAPERFLSGNSSLALSGGKSVPLGAVKEYQVLLSPFDVRYGDFAGALVNMVTKAGTNRFEGSAFVYARNDRLARRDDLAPAAPYDRLQYGLSLGGPIVRDRLHLFVAPEFQSLTSPAPGPYLGQPSTATAPVPVNAADLGRFDQIMRGYGLAAGSAGPVENGNPLRNIFGRLDLAFPAWNSRVVLWHNYARTADIRFSRAAPDTFSLSSYQWTQVFSSGLTSMQVQTTLGRAGRGSNELLVAYRSDDADQLVDVHQPIVRVSVPSTSGGVVTLNSGTNEAAQGLFTGSWTVSVSNNLSVALGATHLVTFGVGVERFRLDRGGVSGSYGTWTFSSLDALEAGLPQRFEVRRDFGSASVPIGGGQYALYAGDQWQVGERLRVTLGLRADLLAIDGHAPYNPVIDSIFNRRTDEMPRRRVHLSPRAGFTWDIGGSGRDQLRGGAGIFTGRPPLFWAHSALSSYGIGVGVLRCGLLPSDLGPPPSFVADYRAAPTACAGGTGLTTPPRGDVDLLDRRLRMAQTLRGSLAYDRRLPWDALATGEVLITRNISDFVFVNLNLEEPVTSDRQGRVLYGTLRPDGVAQPAVRSGFSEVIDLRNTSRNRSYQLSARLEKRFSGGVAATASYTYSRVRDVQTPLRAGTRGIITWSTARAVSGRHDDSRPGISLNDVPHRVVLAVTYTAPWRRWATDLSFYYVGESGSPFTYLAWGAGGRGDLNADGSNANDPIYVPRSALDDSEIRFSGNSAATGADNSEAAQAERVRTQQAAFERFIESSACLRRQRGRFVERNSCREPWAHTTIASVRQAIPIAGTAFEAELDVFNVLNLLRSGWGRYRVAAPALLEHVGQTAGPPEVAQSIFRFDENTQPWTTRQTESAYQVQVALRYRF